MKQELDPKIVWGVIAGVVIVAGVGLWMGVARPGGGIPPSEDVSAISSTYEKELSGRAGGGGGMSEQEMRQQSPGGSQPGR